ncbi:hypothetical protein [Muribaculum intestinale]|uniref:hypothetical protein n=1 Tax=Muribaculum intestinale TaxID=1796646 RepID=UPI0025B77205|nr:hypothetical protein [Muribaculum intestinale]
MNKSDSENTRDESATVKIVLEDTVDIEQPKDKCSIIKIESVKVEQKATKANIIGLFMLVAGATLSIIFFIFLVVITIINPLYLKYCTDIIIILICTVLFVLFPGCVMAMWSHE